MTDRSFRNPVFTTYTICASLAVLKIMGQGWMTVYRLLKVGGEYASPEDLRPGFINRSPDPKQLEVNDYVDRLRRMHRNDLENIPGFLAAGLLFVLVSPPLLMTQLLMYGFVLARTGHAVAYATAQSHEVRSTFYTIGSLVVIHGCTRCGRCADQRGADVRWMARSRCTALPRAAYWLVNA